MRGNVPLAPCVPFFRSLVPPPCLLGREIENGDGRETAVKNTSSQRERKSDREKGRAGASRTPPEGSATGIVMETGVISLRGGLKGSALGTWRSPLVQRGDGRQGGGRQPL